MILYALSLVNSEPESQVLFSPTRARNANPGQAQNPKNPSPYQLRSNNANSPRSNCSSWDFKFLSFVGQS